MKLIITESTKNENVYTECIVENEINHAYNIAIILGNKELPTSPIFHDIMLLLISFDSLMFYGAEVKHNFSLSILSSSAIPANYRKVASKKLDT